MDFNPFHHILNTNFLSKASFLMTRLDLKPLAYDLFRQTLDLFLPLSCILCNSNTIRPISLCQGCQNKIISAEKIPEKTIISAMKSKPSWQKIRYLGNYNAELRELILAGKFQDNLAALKTLGQLFAQNICIEGYDPELVLIPVPLHRNRLKSRGYNQAYEIALPLAKQLGLKINRQCVERHIEAKTQHFLSREQRMLNAKTLFQTTVHKTNYFTDPLRFVVPKKVALIDDIYTTGATIESLSNCLSAAGAEVIEVWIIATTL